MQNEPGAFCCARKEALKQNKTHMIEYVKGTQKPTARISIIKPGNNLKILIK